MARNSALRIVLLLIAVLVSIELTAQHRVVGRVFTIEKTPLEGVTIQVAEIPTLGAITDSAGRYQLTLPNGGSYTLLASHIGYISENRNVSAAQSEVNFMLAENIVNLSTIVVKGTRTEKLLKDTPVATRVISAKDIRLSDAMHIGELMQSELPGIEFLYSMNQQTALNMQGFGGNSVLFLVDGERLAGETLDNIDYTRLHLSNVERVEIVKGAASSLYGSNAVGGVVNLITVKPDENRLNIESRYASNNQWRNGATFTYAAENFNSVTSFRHTAADPILLENPGDYNKIYGFKTYDLSHKMRYETDKFDILARLGGFFRQRDIDNVQSERYRDFSASVRGKYRFSEQQNIELGYSFDQYDKSDYLSSNGKDIRDYSNVQHTLRALYNNSLKRNMILTAGGDFMRDYLMSYQFSTTGANVQYTADLFAQFDWNISERLNLLAGVRFDYFSKSEANNLSPKIAAMYRFDRLTLRCSYAAGFRAPTLKELYMDFNMANIFTIYGNPELKSELSNNFLLSAEYNKNRYNLMVSGFYNIVNDRITTIWSQTLKGMLYSNMERVNIAGAEVNLSAKWGCGISARLSYAYTHEIADGDKVLISNTRPHSATLRVEYNKFISNDYSFNVTLHGRYLSRVVANEYIFTSIDQAVKRTYPEYTMWKLALNNRILNGINLTLSIDNLLDYVPDYYYNNSPTTVGRTYSVGVSVDIERLLKR